MIGWLLGLLGAGRLWRAIQAGETSGECAGPVVKTARGVFDLTISFRRRG
jgi:hypothetical protein